MSRLLRRVERENRELKRQVQELEARVGPSDSPRGVGIGPISQAGERADLSNSRRATRRTTDPLALYIFEQVKDRSAEVRHGRLDEVLKEMKKQGIASSSGVARRGRKQAFDPSAGNLLALGPKFERDELLSMSKAAAEWAESSSLTWATFAAWVEHEVGRPESPFDRLPRSVTPFRRVFGGWSQACLAAGLECGPVPSEVIEEEVLCGLRATAEAVSRDVIRFADYRQFIESCQPGTRFSGLPRSRDAFRTRFGSFAGACARAGLRNGRLINGKVQEGRVTGAHVDYHDEQALEDLRQAAASQGGKPPSEAVFKRWVREADAQARKEGRLVPFLSPKGYRERFGSWPDALHRAGLISETQRRRLLQRRPISDDAIWDTVWSALRKFGPGMSRRQYRGYAHKLIEASDDPDVRVPSDEVVARRLGNGNFKAAIRRVWEAMAGEGDRQQVQAGAAASDEAGAAVPDEAGRVEL